MKVQFTPTDNPLGKLAEAEVYFEDGPMAGLKLIGFAVWERRNGERSVTFPARQYSVNGERRSFALLRPTIDAAATDRFRDFILDEYRKVYEAGEDAAFMDEVARLIVSFGHDCTVEHPGAIHLPVGSSLFVAGDANENWSADFYADAEDISSPDGHVETDVPVTSKDAADVASAIVCGISMFLEQGAARR